MNPLSEQEIIADYLRQGPMTDPRSFATLYDPLPTDVPALVRTIQGLMVHIFWASAYQLQLSPERETEVTLRPVWRKLARILELDPAPITQPREKERKLVGNCRDFTVLTVSMLRARGGPARSRCGFGTYFIPNHYEDHWVLEYWSEPQKRWIMVDAQLDELQQEKLKLPFNPLDVPAGAFVTGGEAWLMARQGKADPEHFGIFDYHGMDFIKGNLLRDFLALNKFEVLPWDIWGVLEKPVAEMNPQELTQLDTCAEICQQADIPAVRTFYETNPVYQAPLEWAE